MMRATFLFCMLFACSNAFLPKSPSRSLVSRSSVMTRHSLEPRAEEMAPSSFSPIFDIDEDTAKALEKAGTSAAIALTALLCMPVEEAMAKGGAYGIFEGRTASMMHPFTMFALFGTSVYSGVLGLKWRQLRDVGEQLKALSASAPKLSSGKASFPLSESSAKLSAELATAKAAEAPDASAISALESDIKVLSGAMTLDTEYGELSALRKKLVAGNLRDKHQITGSFLLGGGVSVSILGAFNTYMRAGKLFPGPHLYAGMAVTILWAVAAALVPAMQKGNETARIAHIGLNTVNVALFAWQVTTGIPIMLKVIEFTKFP